MNDEVTRWENSSLTALIGHLLNHHHPYTRAAFDELTPLFAKVLAAHGAQHPELHTLHHLFTRLRDDLVMHLMKEENILFPYMQALEAEARPPAPPFGSVANPVRMMTMEHHTDGMLLYKMQELSGDFAAPADACGSFQLLYRKLHELADDLHLHMYLENTILFPNAVELERQRMGAA